MAANDVQIRIKASDYASAVLKNVSNSAQIAAASMDRMGSVVKGMVFNAASTAAGIAGFYGLSAAIQETTQSVIGFSRSMETNSIGIGGILSSMTKLNGENLEWNKSLEISKSIMGQLNDKALISNATSEELITTFRGLLGPGLGAGMNIDQIIRLTSIGTTAVKSMGLNKTQLLQELRDLVQGGIQPASSTLATSLGLKDKDIKQARNSAEGLYNFLLQKLEGFEMAGEASKKTMDGIIDQIKDGGMRIGAEGTAPLFESAKQELAQIADSFIFIDEESKKVTLNPELINDLRYASTEAVKIGRELKKLGTNVSTVILPPMRAFGEAVSFVGQHINGITRGIATWMILRQISGMYKDLTMAINETSTAHTFLGRAIKAANAENIERVATAKGAAAAEMSNAMNAAATQTAIYKKAEKERKWVIESCATIEEGANKAAKAGYIQLATQIRTLQEEYVKLGASAKEAGIMQVSAAKAAKTENFILTQQIIKSQKEHLTKANVANTESASITSKLGNLAEIGIVGSAIAGKGAGGLLTKVKTIIPALSRLGTVTKFIGGRVLSSAFGLPGLMAYGAYEGYDMYKNWGKIDNPYNSRAEVFYDNKNGGKYYKNVYDPKGGLFGLWGANKKQELSPEEYAKQYEADEIRKLMETGEWEQQERARQEAEALKLKQDQEKEEKAKALQQLNSNLFKLKHEGAYSMADDTMLVKLYELRNQKKEAEKTIGEEESSKLFSDTWAETVRVENDRIRKMTEDAYGNIYEITHSTIEKQLHDIEKKKEENIRAGMAEVDAVKIAETEKKNIINQAREELIGMSVKVDPNINEYQKQYYDLMNEKLNMEQKFGRESAEIARLYEKKKTQLAVDETKRRIDAVRGLASGAFGGVTGRAKQLETEWKEKQKTNTGSGSGMPDFLGQALAEQKKEQKEEAELLRQLLKRVNISPMDQDLDKKIELANRNPYIDGMFNMRSDKLAYGQESFDFTGMTTGIDRVVEAIKAQRDALKAEVTVRVTFDEDGNARLKNAIAGDIANLITLGGA